MGAKVRQAREPVPLGLQLFSHVAGCSKYAEHLAGGVAVDRGVIQNLAERPVPVAHGQRGVHGHLLGNDLLVDLVGLLGVGKVVTKRGPQELLAGNPGEFDRCLVDAGERAVGTDGDH